VIYEFSRWLSTTAASRFVQDKEWIIPAVQSVHILAIGIVLAISGMINLRVFARVMADVSVAEMVKSCAPWIWGALLVLACTGVILIVGEPVRELVNPAFRIKMVLLVLAIAGTAWAHRGLAHAPLSNGSAVESAGLKALVLSTFLIWLPIAAAGRWIAYATDQ
jgi:uncharacterized membrane protein SirB2